MTTLHSVDTLQPIYYLYYLYYLFYFILFVVIGYYIALQHEVERAAMERDRLMEAHKVSDSST